MIVKTYQLTEAGVAYIKATKTEIIYDVNGIKTKLPTQTGVPFQLTELDAEYLISQKFISPATTEQMQIIEAQNSKEQAKVDALTKQKETLEDDIKALKDNIGALELSKKALEADIKALEVKKASLKPAT